MASQVRGQIVIPCWVDGDEVKALTDDDGRIPISLSGDAYDNPVMIAGKADGYSQAVGMGPQSDLRVFIQGQAAGLQIAQGNPELIKPANMGYTAAGWKRLGLLWGYYDQVTGRAFDLNAAAGTNTLNITAVPANEIWSITRLTAIDINNAPSYIAIAIVAGGTEIRLAQETGLAANQALSIAGPVIAKAGDVLRAIIGGVTLNDDIYFWISGYKMKDNL